MGPHLIYVYGTLQRHAGQVCLRLDGESAPDPIPLIRLAEMFRDLPHRPPAVVYLNTVGPLDADLTPGQCLGAVTPLVLWRRVPWRDEGADTLALAWLKRWLGQGEDPVLALHEVTREHLTTSVEHATLAVHARYRHWRTDRPEEGLRERLLHLYLDREKQKGLLGKWLHDMIANPRLRVMALIPYATPGNRLGDLCKQLCHYLEQALQDRVAIKVFRLQFPDSREDLEHDLEPELRLQLGADEGEPTRHLLRRHAPRTIGKTRPVLWLDWGLFGQGEGCQDRLTGAELKAWLRFTHGYINQHCPQDLNVVCYAALELEKERHDPLHRLWSCARNWVTRLSRCTC
jgi:hypothetical protein